MRQKKNWIEKMCIKGSYEVERGLGGEYNKVKMNRCAESIV